MYEIVGHYSNCNICGAGNDVILLYPPEDRYPAGATKWKAGYRSECHGRDEQEFDTGREAFEWLSQRKWLLATRASKREWREMERRLKRHPSWNTPAEVGEAATGADQFRPLDTGLLPGEGSVRGGGYERQRVPIDPGAEQLDGDLSFVVVDEPLVIADRFMDSIRNLNAAADTMTVSIHGMAAQLNNIVR